MLSLLFAYYTYMYLEKDSCNCAGWLVSGRNCLYPLCEVVTGSEDVAAPIIRFWRQRPNKVDPYLMPWSFHRNWVQLRFPSRHLSIHVLADITLRDLWRENEHYYYYHTIHMAWESQQTFYVKMAWTQYTMRMTEKCCYSLLNIPTPSHPSPSHATWISPLSCRWYGSCPCGQQLHQRGTPGGFSFAHPWSEWNAASPLPAIMYRSTVLSRQLQCILVHTDDVVIFSFRNSIPLSSASVCNIALHLWARTSLLSCVSLSSCSRHIQAGR